MLFFATGMAHECTLLAKDAHPRLASTHGGQQFTPPPRLLLTCPHSSGCTPRLTGSLCFAAAHAPLYRQLLRRSVTAADSVEKQKLLKV